MPLNYIPGRAYSQTEHERINHDATPNDPGTRLVCDLCDEFSGKCEEDGFFMESESGKHLHICEDCLNIIETLRGDC